MKTKQFYRYLPMIIILCAALSCNDNDEELKKGTCKISKIETDGDGDPDVTTYTYDTQGRVISINDDGSTVNYAYDDQNRVSRAENFKIYKEDYEYAVDHIKVIESFWNSTDEIWKIDGLSKCYLNPDGTIKAIAGSYGDSVTYSYDTKKNVVKMGEYYDKKLEEYLEIQYSNIRNPLAGLPAKDNILAYDPLKQSPYMISAVTGKSEDIPFTAKFTYEKNEYNYPVSSKVIFTERNLTKTTTVKYTYSSCQ